MVAVLRDNRGRGWPQPVRHPRVEDWEWDDWAARRRAPQRTTHPRPCEAPAAEREPAPRASHAAGNHTVNSGIARVMRVAHFTKAEVTADQTVFTGPDGWRLVTGWRAGWVLDRGGGGEVRGRGWQALEEALAR